MTDDLAVINTRFQPSDQRHPRPSHSLSRGSTGLKPGVNENATRKPFPFLVVLLALSVAGAVFAAQSQDTEYEAVAEEYVKTYLAAHPLQGTALGFHEYDGKISDYSRLALDAELSRLRRFEDRLQKFDTDKLNQRHSID